MENGFLSRKNRAVVSFLPLRPYRVFLGRPVCISSLVAHEWEGAPLRAAVSPCTHTLDRGVSHYSLLGVLGQDF